MGTNINVINLLNSVAIESSSRLDTLNTILNLLTIEDVEYDAINQLHKDTQQYQKNVEWILNAVLDGVI
jgi:hypothetical protein